MDVKEISSHVSPALYVDMLAGDRSLLRKVFGISLVFFLLCDYIFSVF